MKRARHRSAPLAVPSLMAFTDAVELDDGDRTYRVPAGVTIATLLPLTNSSAEPGLDSLPARGQEWELTRYREYQAWLADQPVGDTFRLAGAFLDAGEVDVGVSAQAEVQTGPPQDAVYPPQAQVLKPALV